MPRGRRRKDGRRLDDDAQQFAFEKVFVLHHKAAITRAIRGEERRGEGFFFFVTFLLIRPQHTACIISETHTHQLLRLLDVRTYDEEALRVVTRFSKEEGLKRMTGPRLAS